jgi:RNA polymerase sigma-70 factor (ECF subfamily)
VEAEDRFNVLYRTHSQAVLRYALRRTDSDTAGDVVADTFLVAWRKLDDVPADPGQAEPWLYAVARRVLANAERSDRRTRRVAARLWQQSHEEQRDQASDPAAVISERQRVSQALSKLAEPDQEALRLVGWEGLDLTGAALAMRCSRSAMAVRLHRARRRLDQALRSVDDSEPRTVRATASGPRPARVSTSDGGGR